MTTTRPAGRTPVSNRQLMTYIAVMALGLTVVQGWTALGSGSRITAVTGLLLVVVALYALLFSARTRAALRQRAYAGYFVHVMTYLLVNGSFWIHAAVLVLSGRSEVLAAGWSGPLISMSVLWGVGLLLHTFGAVLSKGYDDVEL